MKEARCECHENAPLWRLRQHATKHRLRIQEVNRCAKLRRYPGDIVYYHEQVKWISYPVRAVVLYVGRHLTVVLPIGGSGKRAVRRKHDSFYREKSA